MSKNKHETQPRNPDTVNGSGSTFDVRTTDDELVDMLFEKMIVGGLSLKRSLIAVGYDRSNFYKRLVKPGHEDFAAQIEELRRAAREVMQDELIEIADNDELHWSVRKDMIDVRKWMLATREPRFREKKDITTDGKPMLIVDL